MTEVINIPTCDDPRDAIHRALATLARGGLVALPADSSYVIAGQSIKNSNGSLFEPMSASRLSLSLRSVDEVMDYSPDISAEGERLCRRLWPGPIIMESPVSNEGGGLWQALSSGLRGLVVENGHISLRMVRHDLLRSLQQLVASPLVIAEDWGDALLTSIDDVICFAGNSVEMALDVGPMETCGPSTVIRLDGHTWRVERTGMMDEAAILERLPFGVVFVCTGNTCRSPLAAAILRKMLAEKLECEPNHLLTKGIYVGSAGISADYGMPAAAESLALAEEHGLDLASHQSQALTDSILDRADRIYAMTSAHRSAIVSRRPDLAERVELLSREGIDIADPIGGGPMEYERCRSEIEREMLVILEQLPIDPR